MGIFVESYAFLWNIPTKLIFMLQLTFKWHNLNKSVAFYQFPKFVSPFNAIAHPTNGFKEFFSCGYNNDLQIPSNCVTKRIPLLLIWGTIIVGFVCAVCKYRFSFHKVIYNKLNFRNQLFWATKRATDSSKPCQETDHLTLLEDLFRCTVWGRLISGPICKGEKIPSADLATTIPPGGIKPQLL